MRVKRAITNFSSCVESVAEAVNNHCLPGPGARQTVSSASPAPPLCPPVIYRPLMEEDTKINATHCVSCNTPKEAWQQLSTFAKETATTELNSKTVEEIQ